MERYVECESRGLTLRGMLHVPDQRPGKVPFVILFHGFCDDRNEINFVHTELSRRPATMEATHPPMLRPWIAIRLWSTKSRLLT